MVGKQTLLHSEKSSNDSFVFSKRQNRLDPKQMGFYHFQNPLCKKRLKKTEWENEWTTQLCWKGMTQMERQWQGIMYLSVWLQWVSMCQEDLFSEMNSIGEATSRLKLQSELDYSQKTNKHLKQSKREICFELHIYINVVPETDQTHNYFIYLTNNPTSKPWVRVLLNFPQIAANTQIPRCRIRPLDFTTQMTLERKFYSHFIHF